MVGHSDAVPNRSLLGFDADAVVYDGSNALLLTPLTRRMPAARSGLNSPESDAP
jgi:hypothetical protein